jgi:hypothetical protein
MSVTEYNDDTSLMQLEIIKQLERVSRLHLISVNFHFNRSDVQLSKVLLNVIRNTYMND